MHAAAFRKPAFAEHLTPYYIGPVQEVRRESPAESRVLPIRPKGQSTGSASGPPKSGGGCVLFGPRGAGLVQGTGGGVPVCHAPASEPGRPRHGVSLPVWRPG